MAHPVLIIIKLLHSTYQQFPVNRHSFLHDELPLLDIYQEVVLAVHVGSSFLIFRIDSIEREDIYEFKHILIRVNEKKFVTSNSGRKCVLFSNADFTVFESDDQISGWDK